MSDTPSENTDGSWRAIAGWVIAAIALFALLRFPMLTHQCGQTDEQWFAVPGLTVLKEGIPRIPYCPTRQRESFFENADKCLFALPPALYYCQAPFFAVMNPGYAAARMPAFLAGMAGLICTAGLARRRVSASWVLGLSVVMFAISRPMMFTAVIARPDLLCALCGWCAILTLERLLRDRRWRWIVLAGGLCGLGMLFHPYAIVFCIQAAAWVVLMKGSWQERLLRLFGLTACATAVFLLWLPLIVAFPYEFKSQFFSNVLNRSGPGLVSRMLWPWDSFVQHAGLQWHVNESYQYYFLIFGTLVGTSVWLWKRRDAEHLRYLAVVWSGCYLTATAAGIHPGKGYWIYAYGMIYPLICDGCVILAGTMSDAVRGKSKATDDWKRRTVLVAAAMSLIAVMIPGCGIRTALVYLRHWGDSRYHAQNFIKQALADVPKDGVFWADVGYVFDVYLSGRNTVLLFHKEPFWGDADVHYEYLIISQEGLDYDWPKEYGARLLQSAGKKDLPQDCFVEVYVPNSQD